MRSRLSMHVDLSKTMEASILTSVPLHNAKNTPTKVYIPILMPKITKGAPKTKNCPTKGKSILKSEKKPALTGNTLKERNYLDANKFTNENGRELKKLIEQLSAYVSGNITKTIKGYTVHTIHQKTFTYVLEKNSNIKVKFLNGKLSTIQYDVTNDSKLSYTMK